MTAGGRRPEDPVAGEEAGQDDADWLEAMSDVERMDDEVRGADVVDSEPTTGLAERFRQRQQTEPTLTEDPGMQIDPHSLERIRRGKLAIEAQIDLHGSTQEEAFSQVDTFLDESWRLRRRLLLVITGKGTAIDGGGVLRSVVPRWITEGRFRDCLVGIAPANQRDGGDGAVYVMFHKQG